MKKIIAFIRNLFHNSSTPSYKRTINLLLLLVITLTVPLTLSLVKQRTNTQQMAQTVCGSDCNAGSGATCEHPNVWTCPAGTPCDGSWYNGCTVIDHPYQQGTCSNLCTGNQICGSDCNAGSGATCEHPNVWTCPAGTPCDGSWYNGCTVIDHPYQAGTCQNLCTSPTPTGTACAKTCWYPDSANPQNCPSGITYVSSNGCSTAGCSSCWNASCNSFSCTAPNVSSTPPPGGFQIGVNLRGGAFYSGCRGNFAFADTASLDSNLMALREMGGTVVRVFAANVNYTDQESAIQISNFLNKAEAYGISVIISLIDLYNTGYAYYPQGTETLYNREGTQYLGSDFFCGGYQGRYFDFLRTVINANKGHSNIYAWEPGNELKDDWRKDCFVTFMKDTTALIKSIDPSHRISTGMINASHTQIPVDTLYSQLPDVDIISVHDYDDSNDGVLDVQWAKAHGKIAILGEGLYTGDNRAGRYPGRLEFWRGQGVSLFLQWGFMAKGLPDYNDGDGSRGMDTIWHSDYDGLCQVFMSYTGASGNCTSYSGGTCSSPAPSGSPAPTGVITPGGPSPTLAPNQCSSVNKCTQCLAFNPRSSSPDPGPPGLSALGWNNDCSTLESTIDNWCKNVGPRECATRKTYPCASYCNWDSCSPASAVYSCGAGCSQGDVQVDGKTLNRTCTNCIINKQQNPGAFLNTFNTYGSWPFCARQNDIINDWCKTGGLDPQGCRNIQYGACAAECGNPLPSGPIPSNAPLVTITPNPSVPPYPQNSTRGIFGFTWFSVAPPSVPFGQFVLSNIINFIIWFLIVVGTVAALLFIIYAGIKFITAGGDREKIESAKKALVYAIVGILVIAISFALLRLIGSILGINFLSNFVI